MAKVVPVLIVEDGQVVDVEHGQSLGQGDDDVLAVVDLEIVEARFLVGNLNKKVSKETFVT